MDSNKANHEATEVLAAARGALEIQRRGMGVWSNWDLVVSKILDHTESRQQLDHLTCSFDRSGLPA